MLCLVLPAALLAGLTQAASGASVSDFALFGDTGVILGDNGRVLAGPIGSNGYVIVGADLTTLFGISGGGDLDATAGAGSIGGTIAFNGAVSLADGTHVTGDVNGYTVALGGSNTVVDGAVNTGSTTNFDPVVMPGGTVFTPGSGDQSYPNGVAVELPPGSYRDLAFGSGNTLTLLRGDYFIRNLSAGMNMTMNLELSGGGINIYVEGYASFDSGLCMNLVEGRARDVYFEAGGGWYAWHQCTCVGTISAPGGSLVFGNDCTLTGAAWGSFLTFGNGLTVQPESCGGVIPEPLTMVGALAGIASLAAYIRIRRRPKTQVA